MDRILTWLSEFGIYFQQVKILPPQPIVYIHTQPSLLEAAFFVFQIIAVFIAAFHEGEMFVFKKSLHLPCLTQIKAKLAKPYLQSCLYQVPRIEDQVSYINEPSCEHDGPWFGG